MPEATGGLTVAIALVAGMFAQSLAVRLNLPGIVILLLVGAVLGPEALGWVDPAALGSALPTLVGFAVAVVLFEGGMNLEVGKLRRESRAIRMLVSVGAIVTILGATLTARWVLGWDWRPAALFGTLVVVTGPTVVTPILRRLRIDSRVATVLEAEAVFGDAVGAVIAAAAYEFATQPIDTPNVAYAALHVFSRLAVGGVLGVLAGGVLVLLLRTERVIERGLENVFALSFVLALFQAANSLLHESGIASVIAAGIVVGNSKTRVSRELHDFKGALTTMFIGLLFVLLAADVQLKALLDLGWPGLTVVAILMLVVRPAAAFLSTFRSELPMTHRAFVAWLAPRGIIAASVASLFAVGLKDMNARGATSLREMVFLVILVSVCGAGFTGGLAARVLGLKRSNATGWVILGASAIARALAQTLRAAKQEVLCIDTHPAAARAAEETGLRVIYGNALEDLTLRRAEVEARQGFIALTLNEEANLLFAERIRQHNKSAPIFVALDTLNEGVTQEMAHAVGATVLFGHPYRAARWDRMFEKGGVEIGVFRQTNRIEAEQEVAGSLLAPNPSEDEDLILPMLVRRGSTFHPIGDRAVISGEHELVLALNRERLVDVLQRLDAAGWYRVDDPASGAAQQASGVLNPGS